MVVAEGFVTCSEYALRYVGALVDIVGSIGEDLRFDDRDEAVFLAYGGVASEAVGVFLDGQWRRLVWPNLQYGAPLREPCAGLVVLPASLPQVVQALCGGFAVCSGQFHRALVHLYAWENSSLFQYVHEGYSCATKY